MSAEWLAEEIVDYFKDLIGPDGSWVKVPESEAVIMREHYIKRLCDRAIVISNGENYGMD